ncbi:hypothetical protein C8A01DRAFT_37042 [Parachaetomium inaequale]|uniref:Uncharacterized protein n=1 Tax=Parachaetomium inaequale TaxID=2588326 RepID=A0AAN6SQL8_9PEZI|nr:hypothetical protein C8A01DRAFT_37042 [Parachaetomium inaequale]
MTHNTLCHVGALPPELFDKILFELESIRDLANFIATSRFVYRRFEAQRRAVLFRVLQNELGPVLTDARFLFLFPYSDPADEVHYYDWVHTMAAVYCDMLRGDKGYGVRGEAVPSLGELLDLCRTLHKINFLSDAYVAAQLRFFQDAVERTSGPCADLAPPPATAPLSRTERLRVVRAFYRRQIVSNAWASTIRPAHWTSEDTAAISNTSDHGGVRRGLFAAFEPWEMQQIDHAELFITQVCVALLGHAGLHAADHGNTAQPIQKAEFGDLYSHVDRLARYLQTNTSLASTALHGMSSGKSPPGNKDLSREYIYQYQLLPLVYAFQLDRSQTLPDPDRDKRERDEEEIGFVEDHVQLIPFGWVDALNRRYLDRFGDTLDEIPWLRLGSTEKKIARQNTANLWRYTGFALWDRARVEELKNLDRFSGVRTGWVLGC